MNQALKFLSMSFLSLLIASCESKFEEKERVGMEPDTAEKLEYNMKAEDIQDRLAKAQEVIEGLAMILKKIYSPEIAKLTVSDILVQIMDSVKSSQVESGATGYFSDGEIYLSIPGISKECRQVRVRSIYALPIQELEHSIAIQTCKTDGKFEKVVDLKIQNEEGISVLVDKKIEELLPKLHGQQVLSAQGCHVQRSSWSLESIDCEATDIRLNEQEVLQFKEISYLYWRNPVFTTKAILVKNGRPTFNMVFEVDLKGETFSKVTPVQMGTSENPEARTESAP